MDPIKKGQVRALCAQFSNAIPDDLDSALAREWQECMGEVMPLVLRSSPYIVKQKLAGPVAGIPNLLWTLTSDGRTSDQLIAGIQAKGRRVGHWAAEYVISNPQFVEELTLGITYHLVGIRGDEFINRDRITKNIFAEGNDRKYRKSPAFLAALLREAFSQEKLGYPRVVVMHKPIHISDGHCPDVLVLDSHDGYEWLDVCGADPENCWSREDLFLFLAPPDCAGRQEKPWAHLES